MKILFVLHSHSYGGAEMHLAELARGLAVRGHTLAYAGPRGTWLARRLVAAGVECRYLPMHGFVDPWSMGRLAWLARDFGADLIHGHLTRGAYYAGIAGRLAGVPAVATAHSTNAGKHFGRAAQIIAVSGAVLEFLERSGYPPARLSLVYHGVADPLAVPERHQLRAALDLPEDAVLAGIIARLVPAKGQDLAVEALAWCPPAVHLVLLGDARTPFGRQVRARAAALGLTERVHFMGFRDDAPQWMRGLDLVLAPSRREALSLTLAEAAAAARPVVAARVGGIPEIVADWQTGILVPPENPRSLAAAIRRLAEDPGLCARLGKAARERYLREFSLETMIEGTEAVYRSVLGG